MDCKFRFLFLFILCEQYAFIGHTVTLASDITINGRKRKYLCNWNPIWSQLFFGCAVSISLNNRISLKVHIIMSKWFRFHYALNVCWFYGSSTFKNKVKYETSICGNKQKWHYHLTFIHCYFTPCTPNYLLYNVQHSTIQCSVCVCQC